MYSSLSLNNLRGFNALQIKGLRRFNLFVGRNNSGKTTVLEGLLLLGGASNPNIAAAVAQMRGQFTQNADAIWKPLFGKSDPRQPIDLSGEWSGHTRSLQIKAVRSDNLPMPEDPNFPPVVTIARVSNDFTIGEIRFSERIDNGKPVENTAVIEPRTRSFVLTPHLPDPQPITTELLSARVSWPVIPEIAGNFGNLVKAKRESDVLAALKFIDPRISRVEVLPEASASAIYLDIGLDSLLPLTVAGEGLFRLFTIAVKLASVRDGVLLIDEIDNGLHHSVMAQLWMFLAEQCERFNVQVFATTHNDEMIRSALECLRGESRRPGLFRIDASEVGHEVTSYDAEAIDSVLESNFEVRS
ncbi:MAG: AAA family ATPase [Phycisphaerae bacterium]